MINLYPGEGPRMDLWVGLHENRLVVRARALAVEPPEAPIHLPPVDDVLRRVNQPTFHQAIGRDLFRALFPGALADLYRDAFAAATVAGQTLTLELHFASEALREAHYPWELLHDGARFVLGAGTASLIRGVPARALPRPTTPRAPLELLAISASPSDRAPIQGDLEALKRALAPALAADQVDLAALIPPTWDALREWVLAGAPDVLHFAGHTVSSNADSGAGGLVLEGARRASDPVSTAHWGALLAGSRLRLVILSATPDAPSTTQPPLAAALIQAGVPSVIVLPHAMPGEETARFLAAFVPALVEGTALEAAFSQGRAALAHTTAWHLPALYRQDPQPTPEASRLARRVDTVAPHSAPVSQAFRVGVWLLPHDAPPPDHEAIQRLLGCAPGSRPPETLPAASVQADCIQAGLVQVEATATDCAIHGDHAWTLAAWSDRAAPPLWFALTPRRVGPLDIQITLRQGGEPVATVVHSVQVVAESTHAAPEGVLRSHALIQSAQPAPSHAPVRMPEPEPPPTPPQAETSPPTPPYDVLDLLREAELLTSPHPDLAAAVRDTGEHAAIQQDLADLQAALDAEGRAEEDALDAMIRLPVEHTPLRTTEVPVLIEPDVRARALVLAGLVLALLVIALAVLILLAAQ